MVAFGLNAAPVDRSDASKVACNFIRMRMEEQSRAAVPVTLQEWTAECDLSNLYLFTGDNCFVILSADDAAYPILGYSLDNTFDVGALGENTLSWLRGYEGDIQMIREQRIEASPEIREAWKSLRESVPEPILNRAEVKPLIATLWGQEAPYNNACPSQTLVGCVAVVLGQIMKYWEYPSKGNGSHSYYHSTYGSLHADFGNTTYDWDNMPNVLTMGSSAAAKQAVSTLLYQCGVGVEMNYGPDISLTGSSVVINALTSYFRYPSNMSLVYKNLDGYSDNSWKALLKDQLNHARPLYYAGQDRYGHAFICDGYDNRDYFHFNWGWYGRNNGYFQIGDLTPYGEGNFNDFNCTITNLEPMPVSVNAPGNLTASYSGNAVQLQWNAASGASYYKVYRDNILIGAHVNGRTYQDATVGQGLHRYYVKGISASGDRSRRSNVAEVTVPIQVTQPTGLSSSVSDNKLLLQWNMPSSVATNMEYGFNNYSGYSYGYGSGTVTYWGQRYPSSMLSEYVNMMLTKVSFYAVNADNYTLYIVKGTALDLSEVVQEMNLHITNSGYQNVILDNPIMIDPSKDLWVFLKASASNGYPAAYGSYTGAGLTDAAYIGQSLHSFTSMADENISWLISLTLNPLPYRYNVYRDNNVIASNLEGLFYNDEHLSVGNHTYTVRASYNGVLSEPSAVHNVDLVKNDVTIVGNGGVDGDGFAKKGDWVVLSALPSDGNVFRRWEENGVTISQDPLLEFYAQQSRQLTLFFSGLGVEEEEGAAVLVYPNPVSGQLHVESPMMIRRWDLVSVNGTVVEASATASMTLDLSMEAYSDGIYYLRLVTDEGVIVKKVVVKE